MKTNLELQPMYESSVHPFCWNKESTENTCLLNGSGPADLRSTFFSRPGPALPQPARQSRPNTYYQCRNKGTSQTSALPFPLPPPLNSCFLLVPCQERQCLPLQVPTIICIHIQCTNKAHYSLSAAHSNSHRLPAGTELEPYFLFCAIIGETISRTHFVL